MAIMRYYWGHRRDDGTSPNILEWNDATDEYRTVEGNMEGGGEWRHRGGDTPEYHVNSGWWWPALSADLILTEGL